MNCFSIRLDAAAAYYVAIDATKIVRVIFKKNIFVIHAYIVFTI